MREIISYTRPICDKEYQTQEHDQYGVLRWKRCRRTATFSIDGVWRCTKHKNDEFGTKFGAMAIPIRWEKE